MANAGDLFKDAQVLLDGFKIAKSVKRPIQFNIADKSFVVDLQKNKAFEGTAEKPEVTITVSAEDLGALMKGDLEPVAAFMQGKVKVKGNMAVLMQLQSLQPKLMQLRSKY